MQSQARSPSRARTQTTEGGSAQARSGVILVIRRRRSVDTRDPRKPDQILNLQYEETIVKGDTYQFKDLLKKLGFRWNPNESAWVSNNLDVAKQIVEKLRSSGAEVWEVTEVPEEVSRAIKEKIDEITKSGRKQELLDALKKLEQLFPRGGPETHIPFELYMRDLVNLLRKKYHLENADFENVLKKMLEGQIGEEFGWARRDNLQKLASSYVKLREMGLTNMPIIQLTHEMLPRLT